MNDVTSFVTKEAGPKKRSKKKSAAPTNTDDNRDEGEPVVKRKRRGRPPKKPVKADSDSDKYEMDLEDEDVDDPDIGLDDYNVNKISSELKSKNAPGGKKKEFENENEELDFEELDSADEQDQSLLQERKSKILQIGVIEESEVFRGRGEEECARHVTRTEEDGVTVRSCNYCGYQTSRQDTIPEHLVGKNIYLHVKNIYLHLYLRFSVHPLPRRVRRGVRGVPPAREAAVPSGEAFEVRNPNPDSAH